MGIISTPGQYKVCEYRTTLLILILSHEFSSLYVYISNNKFVTSSSVTTFFIAMVLGSMAQADHCIDCFLLLLTFHTL